jgi:hypothetical protein
MSWRRGESMKITVLMIMGRSVLAAAGGKDR